jgi:hypothetical protein
VEIYKCIEELILCIGKILTNIEIRSKNERQKIKLTRKVEV